MAVDLWLEVEAEPADQPDWEFEGQGAALLSRSPNPLSLLHMRGWVHNQIPVGVGLGSSAAARVAAAALTGSQDPLSEAIAGEGHPDNAAAAVMGGVVAVVGEGVHQLPVPDWEIALFVASQPVPTEDARAVLPEQVSRADAVFNLSRVAALVHLLHTRDWQLMAGSFEDRLHQPYRLRLYPWAEAVMEAARSLGVLGVALAGAGPSVFALCERGLGEAAAREMERAAPGQGRGMVTRPARTGMKLYP
jgi:homoserine kinase